MEIDYLPEWKHTQKTYKENLHKMNKSEIVESREDWEEFRDTIGRVSENGAGTMFWFCQSKTSNF